MREDKEPDDNLTRDGSLLRQLEEIVDKRGIGGTLERLAEICFLKADHVEANWQDVALAKRWRATGNRLYRASLSEDFRGPGE